ncbi:4851_t:CDS:2 [Ambispora leptoticha]|uniref:4851_t:CDS:1 n=1 Tax=Ambispora leptoticha TaxID=144679 RepID=A0A9N9C7C0_9GLOM|nr:4851_t:CDS:2 [Ambispora leptoticha]
MSSKNSSTGIFLVSPTKLISAVIKFFTYDYSKQIDDKFLDDPQSDFSSKCSTPSCEALEIWPDAVVPFDNEQLAVHLENPFHEFDEVTETSSVKAQNIYASKSYFTNDEDDDNLQCLQYNEECSFFGSIFGSGYSADEDIPRGEFCD